MVKRLIVSGRYMSYQAKDSQSASAAEHYALRFSYRKSVRIRRDLKHFDTWLRVSFDSSIDGPMTDLTLYKWFFLSHIALYPTTMRRDRLMSKDLDCEFQRLGMTDANALSCRQVFSRLVSVIRWQHHHFNADKHALIRELIPFYRRLRETTRSTELTYKLALQSETGLKVFRVGDTPGAHPERDLVILLMTWIVGCTPRELTHLTFSDLDALGPLKWTYYRHGVPVKLSHFTALSILSLVDADSFLNKSDTDPLLVCHDGNAWKNLTENEIEVIIEQHYRFEVALWDFDRYTTLAPALAPWEEAFYTDELKRLAKKTLANRRHFHSISDKEEHDDWDAAVQKMAGRSSSVEHEIKEANEGEQVDWDAVITMSK
ncbi:TPA: hypothetical protein ACPIBI_001393 [Pseudomonas aeruginosa]|nr:hypothetical protein [Pseudomonas aeruginosa]